MRPINLNVGELAERPAHEDFKTACFRVLHDYLKKPDRILNSKVLVATYIKPRKTKGGIIVADTTMDEDRFQGLPLSLLEFLQQSIGLD